MKVINRMKRDGQIKEITKKLLHKLMEIKRKHNPNHNKHKIGLNKKNKKVIRQLPQRKDFRHRAINMDKQISMHNSQNNRIYNLRQQQKNYDQDQQAGVLEVSQVCKSNSRSWTTIIQRPLIYQNLKRQSKILEQTYRMLKLNQYSIVLTEIRVGKLTMMSLLEVSEDL